MKKLLLTLMLATGCGSGIVPESGTYVFTGTSYENTCGERWEFGFSEEPMLQPLTVDTDNNQIILNDSTQDVWALEGNVATFNELMDIINVETEQALLNQVLEFIWNTPSEGSGYVGVTITCSSEGDCSNTASAMSIGEIPCEVIAQYDFSLVE